MTFKRCEPEYIGADYSYLPFWFGKKNSTSLPSPIGFNISERIVGCRQSLFHTQGMCILLPSRRRTNLASRVRRVFDGSVRLTLPICIDARLNISEHLERSRSSFEAFPSDRFPFHSLEYRFLSGYRRRRYTADWLGRHAEPV